MRRAVVAAMACIAAGAAPVPERVIAAGGIVRGTINGYPVTLRIEPGATAMPLIAADTAARVGLKGGMFGIAYAVGPERMRGRTGTGAIDTGSGAVKRRIGWTPRGFTAAAEGVIGPSGLSDPVVRFVLRAPQPGERTVTLAMMRQGGMAAGWGETYGRIDVGGVPLRVRFDPHHPQTLASAGAGVRIAAAQGGTLAGATARREIAFGIERPVRGMTLATPLAVGPLSIADLGVRTADFGSAMGIPDADADPDETVVSAGKKRDPGHDRLTIGADQLSRCSSIVFDKPAATIRLTCA